MRTFILVPVLSLSVVFGQAPEPAPAVSSSAGPASVVSTQDRARLLLDNSLKDKNPETRRHAVQSLGLVSASEPYISELDAMLEDKDVPVRLAAITSLMDLNSERTVSTLRNALDSDVPEVSFAAAKALWTLNEPVGRDALVSVLSGETKPHPDSSPGRKDALRMLHTPQTLFMFAVKQGAVFAPFLGLGAGISSVQGILSDPGVSGRGATALLLSLDPSPECYRRFRMRWPIRTGPGGLPRCIPSQCGTIRRWRGL